jgi:hypothetical protein
MAAGSVTRTPKYHGPDRFDSHEGYGERRGPPTSGSRCGCRRSGQTSAAFTLNRYGHRFEGHDDELLDRRTPCTPKAFGGAVSGAVVELPGGPPRPTAKQERERPGATPGTSRDLDGAPPGTRTPNRCLKRATRTVSRPAAFRRQQPSTRPFTCRGCPLLTRGCRRSVPPVCPTAYRSSSSLSFLRLAATASRTRGTATRPSRRPGPRSFSSTEFVTRVPSGMASRA